MNQTLEKKFTLKLYRFLFYFIGEVPRGNKKKLKDMAQKIAEGIPLSYRKCLGKQILRFSFIVESVFIFLSFILIVNTEKSTVDEAKV